MAKTERITPQQIERLKQRMSRLADRNPSWDIKADDFKRLFEFLTVQKLTYLYDDEVYERLVRVDRKATGIQEVLLDAFLIQEQGDEIQLKLFQFKYTDDFGGGVSTRDLSQFITRMNQVFVWDDTTDPGAVEAYALAKNAFAKARKENPRAKARVHCYFVINGQPVNSVADRKMVEELRERFRSDREAHGFRFEVYGGLDLYNLCELGRVPIQDEILEINFDAKQRHPLLHHNIGSNPNGIPPQVVVGFVNVNQLVRLVDRYSNNELFEKNVRFFLGTSKEVNRKIIETITSNKSSWFGFMNNGVSITADKVELEASPMNNRVRVTLSGMQIINGCQTVNALYHAKYAPELRDRFQGNSDVMVRIYAIDPNNKVFMDELIIATNSQNSIRADDLVANDPAQLLFQAALRAYRVGYERKQGEDLPSDGYVTVFSKEEGAMAFLAVHRGIAAELRNSLSRKIFFAEDNVNYRDVFLTATLNTLPPDGANLEELALRQPEVRTRVLEILAAHVINNACRRAVAKLKDKDRRARLRKAAYYLARLIFLFNETVIQKLIETAAGSENPEASVAIGLIRSLESVVTKSFPKAAGKFEAALSEYSAENTSDEDAALKNTHFAALVFKLDSEAQKSKL
jgi:AIPR protein